ncbi:MAG TPA: tyrosine-type recombinase/integrase [Pseudonocardiaceae bacterium]|nr:tyrosine-type recombinase/integrase [Pseudonocardiaceae bacterium]
MISVQLVPAQEAFFAARRTRKDSPHTTLAYRRDLAAVTEHLAEVAGCSPADLLLEDLSPTSLRAAFGRFADTHAKSSIARAWSTWNQFLTFCVADGLLGGNPIGAVAKPEVPRATPKPLRGEQTPEQLLSSVAGGRQARKPWPERDVLVVALGLVAGLRSTEMRELLRSSIVGRSGDQRLHVRGKGSRERSVPIERPLEVVIERYLASCEVRFPHERFTDATPLLLTPSGEPIGRGALDYLIKSCYRSAGIHDRVPSGASLHALRHTFATRLAEDGANAMEIMTLLGHATLTTSQNYIEATGRERRAAAASNRTYRALDGLSD